jgi:phosphoenolpyruvate carboxylase
MYSLGIPPELISAETLSTLSEPKLRLLDEYYVHWKKDLSFASDFVSWQNLNCLIGEKEILDKVTRRFKLEEVIPEIMEDLETFEEITNIRLGPKTLSNRKHENITNNMILSIAGNDKASDISHYIEEAAKVRHSLG